MKIISCVPLPGAGVIARHGALVAVTDSRGQDPDPLLGVLTEVAAAAGDGRDLVRMAARAALGCSGQPAWACAGVTADDGMAVLVHGAAVATVSVDGAGEVALTASDSVIPVTRTFTGASISVELAVGNPAPPDLRCWLGDGVVHGGGLALTAAGVAEPAIAAEPAAIMWDTLHDIVPSQPTGGLSVEVTHNQPASDRSAVVVDGVLCASEHFNDPEARACRQCGISLDQQPRSVLRRQRPPLGVLVFDDGTRVTLDGDYVLGREPVLDFDVMAGRARPLRISDPEGTVSRLHLRVSLVGWQVEVSDLGSANGSVLRAPREERTLAPFEPIVLEPGTRIGIGHRSMQYLAYQGVRP
jgi:FHA domain-containing protein